MIVAFPRNAPQLVFDVSSDDKLPSTIPYPPRPTANAPVSARQSPTYRRATSRSTTRPNTSILGFFVTVLLGFVIGLGLAAIYFGGYLTPLLRALH